jgi:Ca-activated chloride channel family protein
MKRSNVNTTVAVLAAVGVLVTGCSSDDDDSGGVADPASPEQTASDEEGLFADEPTSSERPLDDDSSRSGGDAEDRFDADAPAVEPPAGGEAPAGTEAPAEATAEAAADEAATESSATDSEGGLFGSDTAPPSDDGDDARFEDNTFRDYGYRDFVLAGDDPMSTFALDVDTGSYTVTRRWLDEGSLPPIESVRPEEYINAFHYDYRTPRRGLDITIDGGPSPFDDDNYLVRVGVQGEIVEDEDRGPAALTFVVDTSGSMDRDDRLGLVKRSLEILVDELEDEDTVAIVTYDSEAGVVLPPTEVADRDTILDAIDSLRPGGSTNLEAGLRTGYGLAAEAFRQDGINRVVLASDGVANVGVVDPTALAQMINGDADRGIDLVTVGFGMGNFNDVTMEQLADQGDGFYAYVDTDEEAERLFENELTATLLTIAKNAKIQVEFDPQVVETYRLIGFENRGVRDNDFRDDSVDAGELGAGHQVTAIYEVELARGVDIDDREDLGTVFLRWEDPEDGEVVEIDDEIRLRDIEPDWAKTAEDFQLATVVAAFAEVMRDNPYADAIDIDDLSDEADHLADLFDEDDIDDLADLIEHAAQLR